MRSVVVVLPASIWAMMPMFLQRSNGTCLGTIITFWKPELIPVLAKLKNQFSPAVMRKSLVGFGHAVNVFLLLDRCATTIGGIEQLVRELVDHSFFTTSATVAHQPANRERGAAIRIHLHRNLIVRATYAASLHFEERLAVLDCLLEQL